MKFPFLVAAALGLSGCSSLISTTGSDPADPGAAVPGPRYSPVTAGMVDHGPVEPKPWTERNQSLAPRVGS